MDTMAFGELTTLSSLMQLLILLGMVASRL
jgi:hypothetical protein